MATLRQPRGRRFSLPIFSILSYGAVAIMSFHMGLLFGTNSNPKSIHESNLTNPLVGETKNNNNNCALVKCAKCPECPKVVDTSNTVLDDGMPLSTRAEDIFPQATMGKVVAGAALVDRQDFTKTFDIGVPWDIPKGPGNSQLLMLYSHPSSLPPKTSTNTMMKVYSSAEEATQNCNELKVVMVQPDQRNVCVAVMGQWQSYHIHRYMRLPREGGGGVSKELPLRYVSKQHMTNGRKPGLPAASALTKGKYGEGLKAYLEKLPATLDRLGPIAYKVAGTGKAIVVMVCNFGQSELVFNFVCSARARGLDLSRVLLFATDEETIELAKSLDIAVFDVQDAFGEMPKDAARAYGDKTFAGMMMAKVYCVHLINMLGYDLLFQDADVVWYKDPLVTFFDDTTADDFDLYFQDDGARSARYAPYSPNTGFYFVRHNERTEYLFSVFSRMGDLIQQSGSHQSALTSIISEHASWRGLRVKVFGRDDPELGQKFPGGFHYHQRKELMKEIFSGKKKPLIFHMSWTKNKDNKHKFFQQMNDWYVKDECRHTKVSEIDGWDPNQAGSLGQRCCLAEPDFKCHYRDKPSKFPCKDSPPIDAGRPSFW